MLVLSRKVREKILIGDNISVVPLRISGNTVRIGIEAPADVLILREELKTPECDDAFENANYEMNGLAEPEFDHEPANAELVSA